MEFQDKIQTRLSEHYDKFQELEAKFLKCEDYHISHFKDFDENLRHLDKRHILMDGTYMKKNADMVKLIQKSEENSLTKIKEVEDGI